MRSSTQLHVIARASPVGAGELLLFAGAVALVAGQRMAVIYLDGSGWEGLGRRVLFFAATAIVLTLALHFRRFVGAWVIAAGIALNFVPMAAHGGLMPVAYDTVRESGVFPNVTESDIGRQIPNSKDIVLRHDQIRFSSLSDRFVVDLPWYGRNVYSAGDFVIAAGVLLAAAQALLLVVAPGRGLSDRRPVSGPV